MAMRVVFSIVSSFLKGHRPKIASAPTSKAVSCADVLFASSTVLAVQSEVILADQPMNSGQAWFERIEIWLNMAKVLLRSPFKPWMTSHANSVWSF